MNRSPLLVFLCSAVLLLSLSAHAAERQLWLYCATNLQVTPNVEKLEQLWKRAARAGYTHILLTDSKFAKLGDLGDMTKTYFKNLERVKQIAREQKLELVPALFDVGYSNSMLWHDPNLAEGLPVKNQLFVVKNGEARPQADPPVALGAKMAFRDEVVKLDGGVATLKDFSGNGRFSYKLTVAPFRCYHVSVKVKTDNFKGEPKVAALAGNHALQHENLGTKPTQDWTEHHVVFNSLENSTVTLYFGVWGGGKGTLQWKDWKIEEAGLVNVLRRPGAPFVVEGYTEGKDYQPVVDPKTGRQQWKGDYGSWHQPVAIKTKGIPDGTKLRVSWYHPAIIYNGQVSACPSEPKTMELLADQARRMKAAFGTKGYMMSHDEFRTMNWDLSCMKKNMDAGQILAENVRECAKLLSGSQVYVWSDMFDPFHNAVKDYYLVRGDLKGSWEGLDQRVIVVNWNFGKRDQSLKFFADRGHQQVIAGYYDHKPEQIKDWLKSADKVPGVVGVMYTTWHSNYDDLEKFAALCKP